MTTPKDDTLFSKLKESLLLIEKMEDKAFELTENFLKSVSDANVDEALPLCKSAANVANMRMDLMKTVNQALMDYARTLDNLCVTANDTKKKINEKPPLPKPKVKFLDENVEFKNPEAECKENLVKLKEDKKPVRLQMPDSPVLQTTMLNSTVLASAKKIQRTMPNTPPTLRKPTIAERLEIKPKVLNFDDSSIL